MVITSGELINLPEFPYYTKDVMQYKVYNAVLNEIKIPGGVYACIYHRKTTNKTYVNIMIITIVLVQRETDSIFSCYYRYKNVLWNSEVGSLCIALHNSIKSYGYTGTKTTSYLWSFQTIEMENCCIHRST